MMKKTVIVFFAMICSHQVMANEQLLLTTDDSKASMDFLKQKALETKSQKYIYNKYETIIGGGLGVVAGTIGYFSTENKILQIAYSGIQTVGILNVGSGTYNILSPTYEASLYNLGKKIDSGEKPGNSLSIANHFIIYKAKEERAFKYSLMITSGLLTAQYLSNVLYTDVHEDLKRIYLFLGGVNLLATGFSLFYQGDYMSRVDELNLTFVPNPQSPSFGLSKNF